MRASHRVVVLLVAVLWAASAQAEPPRDCSTPRQAAESLFGWLQPESHDEALATQCLEITGRTPAELRRSAVRTKKVFDHLELLVRTDKLTDRSPEGEGGGKVTHVVVHPSLPDVVLEKKGGRWLWSRASLDVVDQKYVELRLDRTEGFVARLPRWLRTSFLAVELWQYLALLLALLVGVALRSVLRGLLLRRFERLGDRVGQTWVRGLVFAIAGPGATIVMAGVVGLAYPQLDLPIRAALAMGLVVQLMFTLAVVWAVYRLVDVACAALAAKAEKTESKLDDQLVPLVRKSLKVTTVVVGGLFILQNMSVDVGSLLAGLGIGGLAFALAAKDTLANTFGSVMIFTDRPFQIGDWVVIGDAEGVIEEVGFRSTRIRTFYNSLITLPNSIIANTKVDNYGARRYRRCSTTLGLSRDTTPEQMQAFVEGVRAIIRANPHTRKDYYEIHMSGVGAHSLDVMLYFFFEVPSWTDELREKHNVFLEIMRLARALGVGLALPTQSLHIESVSTPGAARVAPEPGSPEALAEIVASFGPGGQASRPGGPTISSGFLATAAAPAESET
jgi:MscS family membrane protein